MGGNAVYGLFSVSATISSLSCNVSFEKKKNQRILKNEKGFPLETKVKKLQVFPSLLLVCLLKD